MTRELTQTRLIGVLPGALLPAGIQGIRFFIARVGRRGQPRDARITSLTGR
jgi:hypothetical protein